MTATYLVRLLFCLFAEDTGLFDENGIFLDYCVNHTHEDDSDLHGRLMSLFDTLNKPNDSYLKEYPDYQGHKRLNNLPEHLAKFPYINGELFAGTYLFETEIKAAASMMNDEENKPSPNPIIENHGDSLKAAFEIKLNGLMLETDALVYLDKLEQIAVRVEAAGLSQVLDAKLNEVADILTDLLAEAEKAG